MAKNKSDLTQPQLADQLKMDINHSIPLDRYKLLRVIQAMQDAVLIFDKNESLLLCNHAFERIFTVTQDQLLGQTVKEFWEESVPEIIPAIESALESLETVSLEIMIQRNYQDKIYLVTVIPIEENHQVTEGVAVFHDITTEKQTERMRRDFVANVSHELRTPLSAINGFAETLLDGALEDKAVVKDFVQIIFNHSQRLSNLVRDLLDLSKLEADETPELQPTDLIALVEKVIGLNRQTLAEKKIRLHTVLPYHCPPVLCHAGNIEQVVTNLLDNAIKYTPGKGAVSIRVIPHDTLVQVDVEDTGMGIEKKHINRVFERFYRVDKARSRDLGGTGLGLSIVKHIVQYHGGLVWVESVPGQGSTFSFTLQIAKEPED